MPDGELRRPPQLWEQRLTRATSILGISSGDATAIVESTATPGTDTGLEPSPSTPPPEDFTAPSTPTLSGGIQGITVTWNGLNAAGVTWPYDTSWIEIHMSTTGATFTPTASTLKGRLARPGSFFVGGLAAATTYYFRLRGIDTSGNVTTPSTAAAGTTGLTTTNDYGTSSIGAGAVSFNARSIGGITTTVGSTQPTSPLTGDVWLDSSALRATISTATGNGSQITYTTSPSHPFAAGDSVTITGASNGSMNRTATILDTPAPTATTFVVTAAVSGSATGGTAVGPVRGVIQKRYDGSSWVKQEWGPDTLSANTITARQIAAAAITTGALAAGAITTDKLDAGAVTAVKLSATAIDGKTITGATIRTSGGASRIVLADGAADTLDFYSGGTLKSTLYATSNGLQCLSALTVYGDSYGTSLTGSNLQTTTASSVPNLRSGTNGTIIKTDHINSAQRFKTNIVPMSPGQLVGVEPQRLGEAQTVDPGAVLDLIPVEFTRVSDGVSRTGFIAEDVQAKYPTAVEYDEAGTIEGIDVRGIVAGLLAVVKDQQQRITALEAQFYQ